jgi:hypothetical protein
MDCWGVVWASLAALLATWPGAVAAAETPVTRDAAPSAPVTAIATPPGEEESNDALGLKLQAYVECINGIGDSVCERRASYGEWCDEKKGPTGKERGGVYLTTHGAAACATAVDRARSMPPSLPDVEQAADAYVTQAKRIELLLGKAHQYYERKDYRDDNMAKGRAMHPELMAAWDDFAQADRALREPVEMLVEKVHAYTYESQLPRFEQGKGRSLRVLAINLTRAAERVVKESARDLKDIDLEALTRAVEDYEEAHDGIEAYAAATQGQDTDNARALLGEDFLIAAKELMRRKRDKVPYNSNFCLGQTCEWMVDGSPGKLIWYYGGLVARWNNIIEGHPILKWRRSCSPPVKR